MYHNADRPQLIEFIRTSVRQDTDRAKKAGKFGQVPEGGKSLFSIHTANQWMDMDKNSSEPSMLFGELWYQGELCILFADTNVGKSALAVQIGCSLAARTQIAPFGFNAPQCNVAYVDFELSARQFRDRYSQNDVRYIFPKGFYRAEIRHQAVLPPEFKTFNEYMNAAIGHIVDQTAAEVLIIDNITSLRSGTDRASEALSLMQYLKALKTRHNISILVLAHTPKRNPAKPITRNDLQGSKMLINFADSAFAVGESFLRADLRYLKQIKQRQYRQVYGADNVVLFRLAKPLNFLKFEFEGFAAERNHLYFSPRPEKIKTESLALELAKTGLSQRKIAAQLNVSVGTVNRILKMGVNDVLPC
ncbi:MAG TPA: AAA family ATPase [Mucilaginibacter sp.]|jgi:hypothetical protein|nr:AAA family ATPase [Mucilaginibacter sp.]